MLLLIHGSNLWGIHLNFLLQRPLLHHFNRMEYSTVNFVKRGRRTTCICADMKDPNFLGEIFDLFCFNSQRCRGN